MTKKIKSSLNGIGEGTKKGVAHNKENEDKEEIAVIIRKSTRSGASIPSEATMHSPCFRFHPYFRKISQTPWKTYPNFTFSRKISRFSSAKISDDFFSHQMTTSFEFPVFSLFHYISPLFRKKILFSTYFYKIPSVFGKFTCFLHTLCVFRSPYFDHDAFMHHTTHVLEATGQGGG